MAKIFNLNNFIIEQEIDSPPLPEGITYNLTAKILDVTLEDNETFVDTDKGMFLIPKLGAWDFWNWLNGDWQEYDPSDVSKQDKIRFAEAHRNIWLLAYDTDGLPTDEYLKYEYENNL